jgi:hypothetical protein
MVKSEKTVENGGRGYFQLIGQTFKTRTFKTKVSTTASLPTPLSRPKSVVAAAQTSRPWLTLHRFGSQRLACCVPALCFSSPHTINEKRAAIPTVADANVRGQQRQQRKRKHNKHTIATHTLCCTHSNEFNIECRCVSQRAANRHSLNCHDIHVHSHTIKLTHDNSHKHKPQNLRPRQNKKQFNNQSLMIGRLGVKANRQVDFAIADPKSQMSRLHLKIEWSKKENAWRCIVDGKNGAVVNNVSLEPGDVATLLTDKASALRVGGARFWFKPAVAAAAPQTSTASKPARTMTRKHSAIVIDD